MSFWDKLKGMLGGGENPPNEPKEPNPFEGMDSALVARMIGLVEDEIAKGKSFQAVDLANIATVRIPRRGVAEIRAASMVVERMYDLGLLRQRGYERTHHIYHPVNKPPVFAAASDPPPPPRAPAPAPLVAAPAKRAQPIDPLAAGEILGLSPEEHRKRSLKIDPYKTAWIGRVDTIPPQSDERTALIDRGLILRGLLTPAQIAEIHEVGDAWLAIHEAKKLADAAAQGHAAAEIARRRAERAALKEQKQRASAERKALRATQVAKRRAEDIVFLGRGVSGGLADRRGDVEELGRRGLPLLATPLDVATALGVTIPRLRWLAFHAEAPSRTHYIYFQVPKKSGGTRLLSAPHEDLKRAQHWILERILAKLPVGDDAHGFVTGRSTVSNAAPHVGQNVVVNCDLKDFFPSITLGRVRGIFEVIGYSPAVASILALLCTEPPRAKVEHDGRALWVAVGPRGLPQGAPTSPAISNQAARKLDQRLRGLAAKLDWTYTRYADDLTFSAQDASQREKIGYLLARIRHIADGEGFALNPKKSRVQRAAGRQLVTGIVVNDKPGIPREEVRRLRAILHRARTTGLAAQNKDGRENFEAWLRGMIAYVAMVDPQKGAKLLTELAGVSR